MLRREYRATYTVLRVDPEFLPLSKDAKLYWHTAKLELPVSGIGVCLTHTIAGLASLTIEEAMAAEAELAHAGWIKRAGAVLWIVNGLRHTPNLSPGAPNHRKHIAVLLADLPRDLPLAAEFRDYYAEWFTAASAGDAGGDGAGDPGGDTESRAGGDGEGLADRFPEPRHRDGYLGVRRASQSPRALDYEVALIAEGGERPGQQGLQPALGWEIVGEALHHLSMGGGRVTARGLLAFCERLVSGEATVPSGTGGGRTPDPVAARARALLTLIRRYGLMSFTPGVKGETQRKIDLAKADAEAWPELEADIHRVRPWEGLSGLGADRWIEAEIVRRLQHRPPEAKSA